MLFQEVIVVLISTGMKITDQRVLLNIISKMIVVEMVWEQISDLFMRQI